MREPHAELLCPVARAETARTAVVRRSRSRWPKGCGPPGGRQTSGLGCSCLARKSCSRDVPRHSPRPRAQPPPGTQARRGGKARRPGCSCGCSPARCRPENKSSASSLRARQAQYSNDSGKDCREGRLARRAGLLTAPLKRIQNTSACTVLGFPHPALCRWKEGLATTTPRGGARHNLVRSTCPVCVPLLAIVSVFHAAGAFHNRKQCGNAARALPPVFAAGRCVGSAGLVNQSVRRHCLELS